MGNISMLIKCVKNDDMLQAAQRPDRKQHNEITTKKIATKKAHID
jgi:hypothetical protein